MLLLISIPVNTSNGFEWVTVVKGIDSHLTGILGMSVNAE